MVDAPDNLIFEYLRRLDTKLDRVIEVIGDLKIRMTAVEERLTRTDVAIANLEVSIAGSTAASSGVSISPNRRIEVMT